MSNDHADTQLRSLITHSEGVWLMLKFSEGDEGRLMRVNVEGRTENPRKMKNFGPIHIRKLSDQETLKKRMYEYTSTLPRIEVMSAWIL